MHADVLRLNWMESESEYVCVSVIKCLDSRVDDVVAASFEFPPALPLANSPHMPMCNPFLLLRSHTRREKKQRKIKYRLGERERESVCPETRSIPSVNNGRGNATPLPLHSTQYEWEGASKQHSLA